MPFLYKLFSDLLFLYLSQIEFFILEWVSKYYDTNTDESGLTSTGISSPLRVLTVIFISDWKYLARFWLY